MRTANSEKMTIEDIFQHHVKEGVRKIFAAQLDIIDKHLYREGKDATLRIRNNGRSIRDRTGAMRQAMSNPRYSVGASQAVAEVPLQLRFFDMRHLGNWRVYNRQVWGILYGHTLREVKYEWRQEIAERVRNGLKRGEELGIRNWELFSQKGRFF